MIGVWNWVVWCVGSLIALDLDGCGDGAAFINDSTFLMGVKNEA